MTETGRGRLGAIDGQDESSLAPGFVVRVLVWTFQEYPVLNSDGRQLAGPGADKGILGCLLLIVEFKASAVSVAVKPCPDLTNSGSPRMVRSFARV